MVGLDALEAVDEWREAVCHESELAVRTVLGQQVSVSAARTQAARLVARYGTPLPEPSGSLTHLFPSPAALVDATIPVPRTRAAAVRALARASLEGLDLSWRPRGDSSRSVEVARHLLLIPGIGPWTASYVQLRGLGDPDVFLPGDLVLRRALGGVTAAQAAVMAEAWRPHRSLAVLHLWTHRAIDPPR